jgi:23S rRNA pseudouridine1911/1915/1917 synthase
MIIISRVRATSASASAWGGLTDTLLLDIWAMAVSVTQKSFVVAEQEAGERLDRVLAGYVAELSRSRLKALIGAGAVTLDGHTIRDPNYRVNSGTTIAIDVPPLAPAKPAAEAIPLRVIYEDDDIIVIDKPRNLVVHPAAGNWTGTLVNALIAHCGDSLSGISGERRPGIVHRLDKDTTGVMVVAKNDRAHQALAAQFADHGRSDESFARSYLAFVWGAPDHPHGVVDKPIDRHPKARDRMAVRQGGRAAVTHWQVLERYAGKPEPRRTAKAGKAPPAAAAVASLLACRLETGRTHQIRVHLASIGHPIMGDQVYGGGFRTKTTLLPREAQATLEALGRQALHAHMLTVKHPSTGEILTFRSELPPELARLRTALAAPGGDRG